MGIFFVAYEKSERNFNGLKHSQTEQGPRFEGTSLISSYKGPTPPLQKPLKNSIGCENGQGKYRPQTTENDNIHSSGICPVPHSKKWWFA